MVCLLNLDIFFVKIGDIDYNLWRDFYSVILDMSSTKGVLVKLLKRLVGYWDLAEGFLLLVQQSDNEEFIEELLAFMKNQIKKIKNTQQRIAIKTKLEQIAAEESEDQENAEKILDDLLLNM